MCAVDVRWLLDWFAVELKIGIDLVIECWPVNIFLGGKFSQVQLLVVGGVDDIGQWYEVKEVWLKFCGCAVACCGLIMVADEGIGSLEELW